MEVGLLPSSIKRTVLANLREQILTPRTSALAVLALSIVIIAAAWGFELIGGYKPCPLCLTQRLAYYFAIPASLLALILLQISWTHAAKWVLGLIVLGFVINAGLGVYHSGVEWHFWAGPNDCSGGIGELTSQAGEGLLNALKKTRVIRCDEAPWRLIGLSFAGYNALFSTTLALFAYAGIRFKHF